MTVLYRQNKRLRLRPYEPWHAAMAYTPDKPALHWLNSNSWLLLELCQQTSVEEITRALQDVMPGRGEQARAMAEEGLRDLLAKGLVEEVHESDQTKGEEEL